MIIKNKRCYARCISEFTSRWYGTLLLIPSFLCSSRHFIKYTERRWCYFRTVCTVPYVNQTEKQFQKKTSSVFYVRVWVCFRWRFLLSRKNKIPVFLLCAKYLENIEFAQDRWFLTQFVRRSWSYVLKIKLWPITVRSYHQIQLLILTNVLN